jgi:dipeptidyl aminopeptidase/acylaminoacyl peptidase
MFTFRNALAAAFVLAAAAAPLAQTAPHPITLDDIQAIADVRDPQCSPDGQAVAYVVSRVDVKEDKSTSHVWMIGFDGKNDRQVTSSQDSESSPRFSPDPNESHGISRPSYQRDRLERYLAWYDKHMKKAATTSSAEDGPKKE